MKITRKFLIITMLTLMVILSGNYLWAYLIGSPTFEKMDGHEVQEEIQTTLGLIDQEAKSLGVLVEDWAVWDDSYQFVNDLNQEFITSNLTDQTLLNADLTFIVFLNKTGDVVYIKNITSVTPSNTKPYPGLEKYLEKGKKLQQIKSEGSGIEGVILLPGEAYLIAARPIVNSLGEGPVEGTLIMGKPLGQEMVNVWTNLLHKSIHLSVIDSSLPTIDRSHITRLQAGERVNVKNTSTMEGVFLVNDIDQNPVLLGKIEMERTHSIMGIRMVNIFAFTASALAVVAAIIILFSTKHIIVKPLSAIVYGLEQIRQKADFGGRVAVMGNDEMAGLAKNINLTLESLEKVSEELRITSFSIANASDAVLWIDPEARIWYANQEACERLGYSQEEMKSMKVFDIDPNFNSQRWPSHWQEVSDKKRLIVQTDHITKEGRRIPTEVMCNYIKYKDKEYNVAFARDTTERMAAENELRAAKAKLEKSNRDLQFLLDAEKHLQNDLKAERDRVNLIISSMGEGLLVLNDNLEIEMMNPAAEKWLGVDLKSAKGHKWSDYVKTFHNNEELPYEERTTNQVLKLEKTIQTTLGDDHYYQTSTGRRFPVISVTAPLIVEGKVQGAVKVFKDASQEKELLILVEDMVKSRTRELKEEQGRSQSILENTDEGIVVTNQEGKVIYVNPAFTKLVGYDNDDLRDKPYAEVIKAFDFQNNPLFPPMLSDAATLTAERGTLKRYYQTKDNDRVAVSVFASPVKVEGEFMGVVRIIHDYAKELEMQQRKDDFFSIASHELRTPLTVISGNLDTVLAGYGKSKLSPIDRQLLSDSESAADRLMKMVNDYLNVSRLDQGRIKINMETLDACKIVAEVVSELSPLTEAKKLYLKYHCQPDKSMVEGDATLIREILTNLIGNSIKFTNQGGISIDLEHRDNHLVVRTTDTGIGIEKEKQKLLFQRFQQAMNRNLAREAGGTGLGLYISKEFARVLGGDLKIIKSEIGKGTTFEFTLPLKEIN